MVEEEDEGRFLSIERSLQFFKTRNYKQGKTGSLSQEPAKKRVHGITRKNNAGDRVFCMTSQKYDY